ncbi:hypothetical protein BGZ83_003376 [Gryganskiella cystojenkinii]|nr:hypothetical protein BGZ83_003376 [Gryganskiella cystojenkinii]
MASSPSDTATADFGREVLDRQYSSSTSTHDSNQEALQGEDGLEPVTETWKVSKAGWSNDSFSLFELSPCFEVFPARKQPGLTSTTLGAAIGGPPSSARSPPGGNVSKVNHARCSTTSRDYPFGASSVGSGAGTGQAFSPATVAPERHFIHFLKIAGVAFGGQESESCMLYMDDNLQFGNHRQDFAGGKGIVYRVSVCGQTGFQVEFVIVDVKSGRLGGSEAKARQQ